MKKLSIITPLYKTKERYLADAQKPLEKYADSIEWVLVNDSPDDQRLRRYLREIYSPEYMVVSENPNNIGIFASYYNGFMIASGEYCCILDHDDVFDPGNLINALKENPDIVYADEYKFYDDNIKQIEPFYKPSFDVLSSVFYLYTFHSMMLRTGIVKKALKNKGQNARYTATFDRHMLLEYINGFDGQELTAVHVNSTDYGWRIHPDSTAMDLDQKTSGFFERLKKAEEFFKDNGETPLLNQHNEIAYLVEGKFLSLLDELCIPASAAKFSESFRRGLNFESDCYKLVPNMKSFQDITDEDCRFCWNLMIKTPLRYLRKHGVGTLFIPDAKCQPLLGGQDYIRHIKDVPFLVKKRRGEIISSGMKGFWIEAKNTDLTADVTCIIEKSN